MRVPCSLIAKWKKPGYEKLCCIRCIQTRVRIWARWAYFEMTDSWDFPAQDMNYQGSTCICRVPKAQLRKGTVVECVHCGTSLLFSTITHISYHGIQGAADVARTHSVHERARRVDQTWLVIFLLYYSRTRPLYHYPQCLLDR